MKILVIGGHGTIGNQVVTCLQQSEPNNEIIPISRKTNISVDITDIQSITNMFATVKHFDALISCAGHSIFRDIYALELQDWQKSLQSKLLGQILLVQEGIKYIKQGGSFTITSGILSEQPIAGSAITSTINRGLEGYVLAAAMGYREKARINIVSPTIVNQASHSIGNYFKGFPQVDAKDVAKAYEKSVYGIMTGQIIKIWQ